MSELPVEHIHTEQQQDPNRPDEQDILQTVMEELNKVNDERLFFKSQVRKLQRRAEEAELKAASLQARLDQIDKGAEVSEAS